MTEKSEELSPCPFCNRAMTLEGYMMVCRYCHPDKERQVFKLLEDISALREELKIQDEANEILTRENERLKLRAKAAEDVAYRYKMDRPTANMVALLSDSKRWLSEEIDKRMEELKSQQERGKG